MIRSETKSTSSSNGYIFCEDNMKPRRISGNFNQEMADKCKQFASDSLPTSTDQYARRGQDPNKRYRMIIQLTNGKSRKFLEDMDVITIKGYAKRKEIRIGFGECTTQILPAL